ncbi:MAG TPA: DEAD/DEAH box helicase family protein [Ilumatobacteraceae bacterium]|nr:DEAD/DEAH box helicase family protein [Ilumatobacteraceae bacterium]
MRLRPWQKSAFDKFSAIGEEDSPNFLAVATPGAGKTTFALTCARWSLAAERRRLIVVAPTSHLKVQWSMAAHRLGLQLDPDWTPAGGVAKDVHGIVTTFQQVATGSTAKVLAGVSDGAFVILDELHHAGDEKAWGDAVRIAFAKAHRRLCLSGTPFRSDTASIPFVHYDDDQAVADYEYGYGDALRDGGVVRPVYFPRVDGHMEWSAPDGSVLSASFQDELTRDQVSQRLRAALSLDGEWLPHVIEQGHERLMHVRRTHPDAGGLVIATDQEHAHGIARLIRSRFGVAADVVVSDDPGASKRIAAFATNDEPWLVSVRMVSEGVDIPRLRVGVYATTVSTERFVRWQAGHASQRAFVYLPDDVRLRTHAFQIMESRRHVLRRAHAEDDNDVIAGIPEHDAPFDEVPQEMLVEQLSLFSVLSAVATGIEIHAIGSDGIAHPGAVDIATLDTIGDDEDEIDASAASDDPLLELSLPDIPTDAGWAHERGRSVFEIKDELRDKNAATAKRLVDLTGWTHARVNGEMNRRAKVTTVSNATIDELDRRLRHADEWLDQLRAGRR